MKIKRALSFDDVLLVPQENSVSSRSEVLLLSKVSERLCLDVPILAANMPSVCNGRMAAAIAHLGGLGIIHRMQSVEDQTKEVELAVNELFKGGVFRHGINVGVAVGVGQDAIERTQSCVSAGASVVCIDIAHGHDPRERQLILTLLKEFPTVTIIAGNISTPEAAKYLTSDCTVDDRKRIVFKVGIGGGSVCTTRITTGCGVPTFQSIVDVAEQGYTVIADGGIKNSGDIVKSLAAGAKAVMLGGLLSGTEETPGRKFTLPGTNISMKVYRGAASEKAKNDFYGRADYVEGEETAVNYKGSVSVVMKKLVEGIQSGFTYCGAKNLEELQKNAEFVEITSAGMLESKPHGVIKCL